MSRRWWIYWPNIPLVPLLSLCGPHRKKSCPPGHTVDPHKSHRSATQAAGGAIFRVQLRANIILLARSSSSHTIDQFWRGSSLYLNNKKKNRTSADRFPNILLVATHKKTDECIAMNEKSGERVIEQRQMNQNRRVMNWFNRLFNDFATFFSRPPSGGGTVKLKRQ